MQMVSKPHQFDVVVMPNLYGSVVSNLVCGLIGGPGLLSGVNVGSDVSTNRIKLQLFCYPILLTWSLGCKTHLPKGLF